MTKDDELYGFFGHSQIFRQSQSELRKEVCARWEDIGSDLRLALDASLAAYASRLLKAGKMPAKNESELHCMAIHAEFAKQVCCVEELAKSGCYGAAATLVRRELEMINNCYAHRKGKQRDGRNPHIKPHRHLERTYKSLSGVAHATKRDAMAYLGGGHPFNIDPNFDSGFCNTS